MNHSVTLWLDSLNATGTTYNVYRAAGSPGTPNQTFAKIASALTAKTYTDNDPTLTVGGYTYHVTSVNNSLESGPAEIGVNVPPFPPSGLTATAQ